VAKARRGRGEGGLFELGDGRWMARVWGRDAFGRPKPIQRVRKRKADAAAELAKLKADPTIRAPKGSLAEYLERWLRDVAAERLDPGTLPQYEREIHNRIIPALGTIALSNEKLDPPRISTFYATLRAEGVGDATRLRVHSVLSSALETAVDWGLLMFNPCSRAERPRYEPPERPTLDVPRARKLIQLIFEDRLAGVYIIAISIGIRQGEILGMQWEDLDLEAGILTLRHSLQDKGGTLRLKGLKRRRQRRELPIPQIALEALLRRREAAKAEGRDVERGYVFVNARNGNPIYKSNFHRDSWDPLRAKLELPEGIVLHFHDLRHTLGTLQKLLGADVETRRHQLGHASTKTTSDIYGHVIPEQVAAMARAIDGLLRPAPPPTGRTPGVVIPFRRVRRKQQAS
jgi:integrase